MVLNLKKNIFTSAEYFLTQIIGYTVLSVIITVGIFPLSLSIKEELAIPWEMTVHMTVHTDRCSGPPGAWDAQEPEAIYGKPEHRVNVNQN